MPNIGRHFLWPCSIHIGVLNIGQCSTGSTSATVGTRGSSFSEDRKLDDGSLECISRLKKITDLFPNLEDHDTESQQGRGCAYADRLMEQSLYINDVLVAHASDCLFRLLSHRQLSVHGGFVNLKSGMVNPIKV